MKTLQTAPRLVALGVGVLFVLGLSARADWYPGDSYKMHFPQLPDPGGWDVNFAWPKVLADDWLCTETGPVSDVHFWYSYRQDLQIPIASIHLSIHSDIPVGPNNPLPYSHPGALLWERNFLPGEFATLYPWGTGQQGWYDPNLQQWERPDHNLFGQVNIRIPDPEAFIQQQGKIYWLDISVRLLDGTFGGIGWKTTRDHFNDDAVWGDYGPNGQVEFWRELRDPITGESLDLAFVITTIPEPTSLALSTLGGCLVLLTVWRRRR